MALTTIETDLINKSSPVHNDYTLGSRLQYLDTAGQYGTTSAGYVIMQVDTAGTSNTTAATATAFHGPHGLVYCTSSGYYTLAAPVPGCHLTWFHGGATAQYIRSMQSGSGATGPSFYVGTGTTYAVINTSGNTRGVDFYGISSELWLVINPQATAGTALWALATSSG